MADLSGVFDSVAGTFLPPRMKLDDAGFKAAFEAQRIRDREVGKKLTIDSLCDEVGVDQRVLHKARNGQGALPIHQVLKISDRLHCAAGCFVSPFPGSAADRDERGRQDLAAWPVPLREVQSWVVLTEDLVRADPFVAQWRDEALSLAAAPAIDDFQRAVGYAQQVASTDPAMAAAALRDAALDLLPHGLHVLSGRYVGRKRLDAGEFDATSSPRRGEGVRMSFAMEVWVQPRTEDLTHTVDRSAECQSAPDRDPVSAPNRDPCSVGLCR